MIVDDQIFQAEGLQMMLGTKGILSDVALSGYEAIKMIESRFAKIDQGLDVSQY